MVVVWHARAVLAAAGVTLVTGCGEDGAASERRAQIAFTANQGGHVSVVVAAADGRRRARLERRASSPAWSPDGERLAFARERGDDSDIAVMEADGSAVRSVTSGAGRDRDPAFSPDGRWIALTREVSDLDGPVRAAIHVVRTDGSGLRPVTTGDSLVGQPAWAPDGRRLAFVRVTTRGRRLVAHVHVADAVGGGELELVEGHAPAWAPDGRRLAYVSIRDRFGRTCFHDCTASGEIHVVGADGRGDRRLTRSRADDGDPVWASGGRQILFSSDRSDRDRHDRELYAMSAVGDCVTRLTNASSWSLEPAWRPGGVGTMPCERDGVAPGARRALVDVDLRPARAFSLHPLFWLGRTHRGLLLSHAARFSEGFDDQFSFIYDDCGRTRGAACPPSVQVQNRPLCWWRDRPAPVRLRRIGRERGAPVYHTGRDTGEEATAEVHTGDAAVSVRALTRRGLRRGLAALRPLGGEPGAWLSRPARRCR
jgi:Tol biopolymer transport system component